MISISRVADKFSPANRFRISAFQSGMAITSNWINTGYAIKGGEELFPCLSLFSQHCLTLGSEFVKTPPSLTRLFNPFPRNQTAFFQAVQQWVKRRNMKLQHTVGTLVD